MHGVLLIGFQGVIVKVAPFHNRNDWDYPKGYRLGPHRPGSVQDATVPKPDKSIERLKM